MKYLFRDQWREVPRLAPYPACLLVNVMYAIPLAQVASHDQRHIKRDWRKVQQFLLAEGVGSTVRKIQSKREQERLLGDFHVVIAVGTLIEVQHPGPVLCVGTRHPKCAEVMLFRNELIVPLPSAPEPKRCVQAVHQAERSLGLGRDGWESLGGYNFYSDLPPAQICVRAAREVAACLTAVPSQGLFPQDGISGFNKYSPIATPPTAHQSPAPTAGPSRGVIAVGAGDYMRAQVIPALQRTGARLHTVVDLEPHVAEFALKKFGFARALTDWREAIAQDEPDSVIVATYHDSHAQIAAAAIRRGKKVLVEKPPAVCPADLALLLEACQARGSFLEVGFNRRFAPFSQRAKKLLTGVTGPTTIICIVKEVEIPDSHWYRWPKEGTRITGNICHWIDLSVYLIGSATQPVEMVLTAPADKCPDEERGVNILFGDGSSATIIATTRGDSTLGVQEFIEIRKADLTIKIDDFRKMIATRGGHAVYQRRTLRDKGHERMYRECMERMKNNEPSSYPMRDLRLTTMLTIRATEMVRDSVRCATIDIECDNPE
ncbi:MAG: Gfo/Idh/MocA family protein [Pyrinomonadaceae bacterium]